MKKTTENPLGRSCTIRKVRIKGLEPPRLSASDPKSDVATNYTISASVSAAVGRDMRRQR